MEKVANSVLFPCKYASSGCEVTLPHTDKTEHEELCEFRPYSCPCPGASCKWQGSLDAVMPHLMHQHKSITTLQVRPMSSHDDDEAWSPPDKSLCMSQYSRFVTPESGATFSFWLTCSDAFLLWFHKYVDSVGVFCVTARRGRQKLKSMYVSPSGLYRTP